MGQRVLFSIIIVLIIVVVVTIGGIFLYNHSTTQQNLPAYQQNVPASPPASTSSPSGAAVTPSISPSIMLRIPTPTATVFPTATPMTSPQGY